MHAHVRKPGNEAKAALRISQDEFLRFCREGNLAAVTTATEAGFNVDFSKTSEQKHTQYSDDGSHSYTRRRKIVETPLSAAIFYGQKDVAKYLAQRCNSQSCTYPHLYAYKLGDNWGFDVSQPGTETNESFQNPDVHKLTVTHSPLTLAITRGYDEIVNHLLNAGASPLFRPSPVGYENSDYVTALHMALVYKDIKANTVRKMVTLINKMRMNDTSVPEIADLLGREFSAPRSIDCCSCCYYGFPDSVKYPRNPFAIVERELSGFTEGRTSEDLHAALSYRGTDLDALTGRDKPVVVPVSSDEIASPGAGAGAGVSPSTIGRPLLTPSSKRAVTPA